MEEDKKGQQDTPKEGSGPKPDDHAKSPQKEVLEKRTNEGDESDNKKDKDTLAAPEKKTEDKAGNGQGEPPLTSAVEKAKSHIAEPKMFDTSGQDTNE